MWKRCWTGPALLARLLGPARARASPGRLRFRWAPTLAVAAVLLGSNGGSPPPARADETNDLRHVVVLDFEGPGGGTVRRVVVRELQKELHLVPRADVAQRAEQLGVRFDGPGEFTAVARALDLHGFVEGRVARRGELWRVVLRVRDGKTGFPLGTVRVTGTATAVSRRLRRAAGAELRELLRHSEAPVDDVPSPQSEDDVVSEADDGGAGSTDAPPPAASQGPDDPVDGTDSQRASPTALGTSIGFALFGRRFDYRDDLFGELSEYRLPLAPAAVLRLEWFPGAHFDDGAAAALGLSTEVVRSIGIRSTTGQGDGGVRETSSLRWEMDVRARHRFDVVGLGLAAGYGIHSFSIDAGPAGPPDSPRVTVPSVRYRYVRAGGSARVGRAETVSAELDVAWLHLLDTGPLGSWFPRLHGAGAEVGLRLRVPIASGFAIGGGVGYRRYFFSLRPEPGDDHVAGGAVDQQWTTTVSMGWSG